MPEWLSETSFLIVNWKWLALASLFLVGALVDRAIVALLDRLLKQALLRADASGAQVETEGAVRPFGMVAVALLWAGGVHLMAPAEAVERVLQNAILFFGGAATVWGIWRLIEVLTDLLTLKASETETRFDDLLVPLLRKGLKVAVAAFGLAFIASNLNIDISSLLAGLGLGGLAFALAAQDTVKNVFGTLTVILDRPFDVGDWIKVEEVEGTVESVGFRSTRVRTFYDSVVTVPNGNLLTATVDNLGVRRFRRWKTVLSLTYDTPPERLEAFCEGVRELIRAHPHTRKDYFQVYFNAFNASSLDVLLYVFHEVPDWTAELAERHRLGVDILRLAKRLGVEFAFPTQTVHLMRPGEADPDRADLFTSAGSADPAEIGRRAANGIAGVPAGLPQDSAGHAERDDRGDG